MSDFKEEKDEEEAKISSESRVKDDEVKSQPKSGLQEETPADFLEVELLREQT